MSGYPSRRQQSASNRKPAVATLFRNANIIDGAGTLPWRGDVLVEANRILAAAPAGTLERTNLAREVDCDGATLMPGLVEPHAHLSFVDQGTPHALHQLPVEEHLLLTLKHAKLYLDQGFTSCFSAGGDQAAARRRDAQCNRRRPVSRPAPARRERAAHCHRRRGRSAPIASRSGRIDVHDAVRRTGRVSARRARGLPRRRGRPEDRAFGRHVDTRNAVRADADDRRRGRGRDRSRARARQASSRRMRAAPSRSRCACATASMSSITRAMPTSRRCDLLEAHGSRIRRAGAVGDVDAPPRSRQVRPAVDAMRSSPASRAICKPRSSA